MPSDDDIIIRNGTLHEWFRYYLWQYFITFGRKVRIRALWFVLAVIVLIVAIAR